MITIDIDKNEAICNAVFSLTGQMYHPSALLEDLEVAYRTYAYNHVALEEDSHAGKEEAANVLLALETLIDGLRGKYLKA